MADQDFEMIRLDFVFENAQQPEIMSTFQDRLLLNGTWYHCCTCEFIILSQT